MKKDEKGSIMLEYVISLGIAVPFLVFGLILFQSGTGWTTPEDIAVVPEGWAHAVCGRSFILSFQRLLTGIALPIP